MVAPVVGSVEIIKFVVKDASLFSKIKKNSVLNQVLNFIKTSNYRVIILIAHQHLRHKKLLKE